MPVSAGLGVSFYLLGVYAPKTAAQLWQMTLRIAASPSLRWGLPAQPSLRRGAVLFVADDLNRAFEGGQANLIAEAPQNRRIQGLGLDDAGLFAHLEHLGAGALAGIADDAARLDPDSLDRRLVHGRQA